MKTDFCIMSGKTENVSNTMANQFVNLPLFEFLLPLRLETLMGKTIPCHLSYYDEKEISTVFLNISNSSLQDGRTPDLRVC